MGVGDFFFLPGCILGVIEYVHRYYYSSSCRGCVGVAIICKNQQSMRGKGGNDQFFPRFFVAGLWQIQRVERARLHSIR